MTLFSFSGRLPEKTIFEALFRQAFPGGGKAPSPRQPFCRRPAVKK
jgi:hypothetical protein